MSAAGYRRGGGTEASPKRECLGPGKNRGIPMDERGDGGLRPRGEPIRELPGGKSSLGLSTYRCDADHMLVMRWALEALQR